MTLVYLLVGMAMLIGGWFKTIKRQVLKHHDHKVKRRPRFTNHTPSNGVAQVR